MAHYNTKMEALAAKAKRITDQKIAEGKKKERAATKAAQGRKGK
jgi:hypothetical protein